MLEEETLEVLLVEGHECERGQIQRSFRGLSRLECRLTWARSLCAARSKLAGGRFHVALIDLDLPDSCGVDTLDEVLRLAPHLPVVVLTGPNTHHLAIESLRRGAQDHLDKCELSAALLERTIEHAIERLRLLERVRRSERMASVGQLSAGIAHELNSPLAQVLTEMTEMRELLKEAPPAETLEGCVSRALQRVEQIRATVSALYSFSSAQQGHKRTFNPRQAVQLARRLAENQLKHVATLEEQVGPLPLLYGHQGRFIQAILDLLGHAGDLGRRQRQRLARVWLEAFEEAGTAVVVVEDEGPPLLTRAPSELDPSKAIVSGADLQSFRLTTARDVVEDLGGSLQVLAGRFGGARFELRIPGAAPTWASPNPSTPPVETKPGRAHVLWIDDDVHLLRAFERRLHRDHDVDVCESAEQALMRIEAGERWDAICCDLMMPFMSGREFESILSRRYPELASRLIFVTGGVFTEDERRFLEESQQPRLYKPFDWSALLDAVDQVRWSSAA